MSYVLQAIVGAESVLTSSIGANVRLVRLPLGLALVPLVETLRAELSLPHLPLTDDGVSEEVPEPLAKLCRSLSRWGRIAYVEADLWAGDGLQAAVLAEMGHIVRGPDTSEDAINAALRFLGADRGTHRDEFEAADLGRFRHTEEWIGSTD